MASKALSIIRIPELRRRLLFTLGMLIVYRLGSQIPLPGINLEKLGSIADQKSGGAAGGLFGLMNAFSGASFQSCSLFSLGVMPYISASIIFSILVKIIPSLEALSKEGAAGYKKINQYTRYLTVPICLLQSLFVLLFFVFNEQYELIPPGTYHWWGIFSISLMLALTAGTLFLMWIGEQIQEYGIGNGISLIIMAGIIDRIPSSVAQTLKVSSDHDTALQGIFVLASLWIVAVVAIVYITKGQRRIPIQQAKLTRGQRIMGGMRHYLPFKLNQAGVMPIIFASAIFVVPSMLFQFVGWDKLRDVFLRGTGFTYIVCYTGLIFFFSFFWNTLTMPANEIANNLKEGGSFIPGIRPGRKTAEFLDHVVTRITFAGSAFLAVIALVPNLIHESFNLDYSISTFLGGTSILIVVGVALDLVDRLNAHLVMHNYEQFGKGGGGGWARSKA